MNTTYTFLAETEHNFEYFLKGAGFYFHSLEVYATDPDALNNEE